MFIITSPRIKKTTINSPIVKAGFLKLTSSRKNLIKSYIDVPEELLTSFYKTKDKKGDAFIQAMYKELVNYFGLKDIAPKKIRSTKGLDKATSATTSFVTAEILYNKNILRPLTNSQKINTITHELMHFRQAVDLIRSEKFGIDKFAMSCAERIVNYCRNNQKITHKIKRDDEYWEKFLKRRYKSNLFQMKRAYSKLNGLPKIPATPEREAYLNRLIEANRIYNSASYRQTYNGYANNLLEKEARSVGFKMECYYKFFEAFLKMAKKN